MSRTTGASTGEAETKVANTSDRIDEEMRALAVAVEALRPLDDEQRERVIRTAASFLGINLFALTKTPTGGTLQYPAGVR